MSVLITLNSKTVFLELIFKETLIKECKEVIERKAKKLSLKVLGYRVVPVDNEDIQGADSGKAEPSIQQLFIERPSTCD